jgi:hypothetical protein
MLTYTIRRRSRLVSWSGQSEIPEGTGKGVFQPMRNS